MQKRTILILFLILVFLGIGCKKCPTKKILGTWHLEYSITSNGSVHKHDKGPAIIFEIKDSVIKSYKRSWKYSFNDCIIQVIDSHLGSDTAHLQVDTLTNEKLVWTILDTTRSIMVFKRLDTKDL